MQTYEIRGHVFDMTFYEDGTVTGSLGNLTDEGWFWDFDGNWGFLLALSRLIRSRAWDEFFEKLKETVPIDVFRKAIRKSIEDNGIYNMAYNLAGDNVTFRFGEGWFSGEEDNYSYMMEETVKRLYKDDCVIRKYGVAFVKWLEDNYDDVWIYYDTSDAEEVVCSEVEDEIKVVVETDLADIRDYRDLKDFADQLIEEMRGGDLFYDIAEIWKEYIGDAFHKALEDWTEEHEEELNSFGINVRHPNGRIRPMPLDDYFEMHRYLCED